MLKRKKVLQLVDQEQKFVVVQVFQESQYFFITVTQIKVFLSLLIKDRETRCTSTKSTNIWEWAMQFKKRWTDKKTHFKRPRPLTDDVGEGGLAGASASETTATAAATAASAALVLVTLLVRLEVPQLVDGGFRLAQQIVQVQPYVIVGRLYCNWTERNDEDGQRHRKLGRERGKKKKVIRMCIFCSVSLLPALLKDLHQLVEAYPEL